METKEKITKHKSGCSKVFSRYDLSCTRCIELKNGAPARDGWQKSFYERQAVNQKINGRAHSCNDDNGVRRCAIVCTFGEW